ncbi:MAG: LysR family transcriptional regulator [Kofleriaceae bacterium]|nr:LysR family transcriptional regulator [Kofleriaceae bacterium]
MNARADLFGGVLPFVRTAEERSFGRAAASLGVSTAAVSKAVRKLEDELGVKLLDRSSRLVTPTREGEVFLERCRQAVLHVQGAREAMQATRREPRGEVRVTLPYILTPFVMPHLPRLSAQYPQLSFRFHVSDRVTRVAEEKHDVAIRMGELESSSLVARLLRRTRWVTVAAPSYLARRSAPRVPAELHRHDCLLFVGPDGVAREWWFREDGKPRAMQLDGRLFVDLGSCLLQAAAAGMGICQVLDFMAQDGLRDGTLVEVLPELATDGPNIHALATSGRASSANVRAFMRFLVDAFKTVRD